MNNKLEKLGQIYRQMEPPAELNDRIQLVIQNHRTGKQHKQFKKILLASAASFFLLCIALNSNQAFAEAASKLPLIGPVVKILTFSSYKEENRDLKLSVEIPEIKIAEDTSGSTSSADPGVTFEKKINEEIKSRIAVRTEESKERIEEYKQAFISTGGTAEEFAQKNIESVVSYDIKYQKGPVVSFVITAYETWSNAYSEMYFYNLNCETAKELTLEDMLGVDYISKSNKIIKEQMTSRLSADPSNYYFTEQEGGFSTVDQNTTYYLNGSGNPVIVFAKYEVAPGSMGSQEFEIPIN